MSAECLRMIKSAWDKEDDKSNLKDTLIQLYYLKRDFIADQFIFDLQHSPLNTFLQAI
jgi:hypothetical protein